MGLSTRPLFSRSHRQNVGTRYFHVTSDLDDVRVAPFHQPSQQPISSVPLGTRITVAPIEQHVPELVRPRGTFAGLADRAVVGYRTGYRIPVPTRSQALQPPHASSEPPGLQGPRAHWFSLQRRYFRRVSVIGGLHLSRPRRSTAPAPLRWRFYRNLRGSCKAPRGAPDCAPIPLTPAPIARYSP